MLLVGVSGFSFADVQSVRSVSADSVLMILPIRFSKFNETNLKFLLPPIEISGGTALDYRV